MRPPKVWTNVRESGRRLTSRATRRGYSSRSAKSDRWKTANHFEHFRPLRKQFAFPRSAGEVPKAMGPASKRSDRSQGVPKPSTGPTVWQRGQMLNIGMDPVQEPRNAAIEQPRVSPAQQGKCPKEPGALERPHQPRKSCKQPAGHTNTPSCPLSERKGTRASEARSQGYALRSGEPSWSPTPTTRNPAMPRITNHHRRTLHSHKSLTYCMHATQNSDTRYHSS